MAHFVAAPARRERREAPAARGDAAREPPRAGRRCSAAAGSRGATLFGINTGLRGDDPLRRHQPLARAPAGRRRQAPARGRARARASCARCAAENIVTLSELRACLDREVGPAVEVARLPRRRGHAADEPDGDLHLGHDGSAQGHQQQPLQAVRDGDRCIDEHRHEPRRHRLRVHAAVPLELAVRRADAVLLGRRQHGPARALQRQPLRARLLRVRRQHVELRGRAGALRARGDREGARRRPRAHPPRGDREPEEPAALRDRQRRVAGRHRQVHRMDGPRRHVRAVRLDRGRDQHVPAHGRPARQRRRGHRSGGQDPERARRRVPARRARRRGQDHELRRRGGRDLPLRARDRAVPGLLRQPRREHLEVPRRRVPLRRSRPHPGAQRQALPVLRRPHRRLDPQGRRELLGAAGRAPARRAPGRAARRRLRRAVRGLRRAGDGGAEAARGHATSIRRASSSSARGRSATAAWTGSGSPTSCASSRTSSTPARRRCWCAT